MILPPSGGFCFTLGGLPRAFGGARCFHLCFLKKPDIKLSQSLATLIEEKYGYNAEWVLSGVEPKLKQVGKNKSLSNVHQKALVQLEKMSDSQARAVLAFINSLEEVEKNI